MEGFIHELKIPMYLDSSVEMNDVAEKVITDRQTDQHTDTQDKYRNPPAHARRGLIIVNEKCYTW